MSDELPETGDRPAPPGSPPILVDTSADPVTPEPQGDRHAAGVSLVRDDQRPPPTAAEYRAAGYGVPDHDGGPVPDDETPGLIYGDRRAPQGTVILADKGGEPEPIAEEEAPATEEPSGDSEPEPDAASESPEEMRADQAAELAGRQAAENEEPRTANPHDRRTTEGKAWDRGWDSAQP